MAVHLASQESDVLFRYGYSCYLWYDFMFHIGLNLWELHYIYLYTWFYFLELNYIYWNTYIIIISSKHYSLDCEFCVNLMEHSHNPINGLY